MIGEREHSLRIITDFFLSVSVFFVVGGGVYVCVRVCVCVCVCVCVWVLGEVGGVGGGSNLYPLLHCAVTSSAST